MDILSREEKQGSVSFGVKDEGDGQTDENLVLKLWDHAFPVLLVLGLHKAIERTERGWWKREEEGGRVFGGLQLIEEVLRGRVALFKRCMNE